MALTIGQWDKKLQDYTLHVKHDYQLDNLVPMYQRKIQRVKGLVAAQADLRLTQDQINVFNTKLVRLESKLESTQKEITSRTDKTVVRNPIGTTYYIDLDAGNDANDGLAIGTPWLTLTKYTVDTVRSAGDIAYVRANTDEVRAASVGFDEDGSVDSPIYVIGCDSVTNDPWSDGSDVKPIIDFNDLGNTVGLSGDYHWHLTRLDLMQSNSGDGNLIAYNSLRAVLTDCVFRDAFTIGQCGAKVNYSYASFNGCEFKDNLGRNLWVANSRAFLEDCIIDGGAATTDYGIYLDNGIAEIINTTFGVSNTHDAFDIFLRQASYANLRNCNLASTGKEVSTSTAGTFVKSEDNGQVYGAHKAWCWNGEIEKETTIVRSGGASSSAKMSPNADCGLNYPLTLSDDNCSGDFKIWCPASATTVTIYIRGFGWTGFPTAAQLFVEAEYLDHATNATRTAIASNDVLSDNTTWVAFDVTFTPLQAGWAYIAVKLGHYEAASGVYVDVKPVIT